MKNNSINNSKNFNFRTLDLGNAPLNHCFGSTWYRNRSINVSTGREVVSHRPFFLVFLNQNSMFSSFSAMMRLLLMALRWVYRPIYLTTSSGPAKGGLEKTTHSLGTSWYSHCLKVRASASWFTSPGNFSIPLSWAFRRLSRNLALNTLDNALTGKRKVAALSRDFHLPVGSIPPAVTTQWPLATVRFRNPHPPDWLTAILLLL